MEAELEQVEFLKGKIETVMAELDGTKSREMHTQYIAGWIEGLHDMGMIATPIRDTLYEEYVC